MQSSANYGVARLHTHTQSDTLLDRQENPLVSCLHVPNNAHSVAVEIVLFEQIDIQSLNDCESKWGRLDVASCVGVAAKGRVKMRRSRWILVPVLCPCFFIL